MFWGVNVLAPTPHLLPLPQHNCDPQFFTTVVFYSASVSLQTLIKFEVFDVYDRHESKVGVVFLVGVTSLAGPPLQRIICLSLRCVL